MKQQSLGDSDLSRNGHMGVTHCRDRAEVLGRQIVQEESADVKWDKIKEGLYHP